MRKSKILIVEDEMIIAFEKQLLLKNQGYEVIGIADTGQKAIEYAQTLHPDLILMDIKLIGPIDGIEAAQRIKAKIDIPVIYLTAYSDQALMERARSTKPIDIILKTSSEHILLQKISEILKDHNLNKLNGKVH